MAEMAVKLKDATDRNEALGKERLAGQEDLEKATAEANSLQHVCEMQIVPLLWRAFGPNLLKPRSRPEGVMQRPRGRPRS